MDSRGARTLGGCLFTGNLSVTYYYFLIHIAPGLGDPLAVA